jgi:hypothetical protein
MRLLIDVLAFTITRPIEPIRNRILCMSAVKLGLRCSPHAMFQRMQLCPMTVVDQHGSPYFALGVNHVSTIRHHEGY